jgi:hypothetical protein
MSQSGLSSSPITITSRIRSATDPNLLVPIPISPPMPSTSEYLMYHDEGTSNHSEYPAPAVAENLEVTVTIPIRESKQELEYRETEILRDSPDHTESIGPHWERQSRQSSGSEVSLACLQGRIQQMEETHHSTNEELQATLQELADLQVQLNEFQSENDRLTDEKMALKRSLEHRTEQLQQNRDQVLFLSLLTY